MERMGFNWRKMKQSHTNSKICLPRQSSSWKKKQIILQKGRRLNANVLPSLDFLQRYQIAFSDFHFHPFTQKRACTLGACKMPSCSFPQTKSISSHLTSQVIAWVVFCYQGTSLQYAVTQFLKPYPLRLHQLVIAPA